MTQVLMTYVAARHEVLRAVLEMLAAEYRLSDEDSSALALTAAETGVDVAARELAGATDALAPDRQPAGWREPPALSGVPQAARGRVVQAALRDLSAQHADESADADAEAEYAEDRLALACRNLAADVAAREAAR